MRKTNINAIKTKKIEVSTCPYCGCDPELEIESIEKASMEDGMVINQRITCSYCRLSAPIDVWEKIASKFKKSIEE